MQKIEGAMVKRIAAYLLGLLCLAQIALAMQPCNPMSCGPR